MILTPVSPWQNPAISAKPGIMVFESRCIITEIRKLSENYCKKSIPFPPHCCFSRVFAFTIVCSYSGYFIQLFCNIIRNLFPLAAPHAYKEARLNWTSRRCAGIPKKSHPGKTENSVCNVKKKKKRDYTWHNPEADMCCLIREGSQGSIRQERER